MAGGKGAKAGAAKKGGGKKVNEKQKQRIVEDKTFGLKNKKKSAKVQKYVQTVQKQVDHQVGAPAKKKKTEVKDELVVGYNPAIQQKRVEKGRETNTKECSIQCY